MNSNIAIVSLPTLQTSHGLLAFDSAARHNSVIGNQVLFANNRNRFRWVVLCLSQDGACTDSFENIRENSLKGDLSNDITLNPPLFSLVNTFNLWCYQRISIALRRLYRRKSLKVCPSISKSCLSPILLIWGYELQRHNIENSKQMFPGEELRGYNSYIHVPVGDLYISFIGLPYSASGK